MSIGIKKDIVCVVLYSRGGVVCRHVERIKDTDILSSSFKVVIQSFIISLRVLRDYFSKNQSYCDEVCFELKNTTFVSWVNNRYSKPAYESMFQSAMSLLQDLPIRYMFSCVSKPRALAYASEEFLPKLTLSGLDITAGE